MITKEQSKGFGSTPVGNTGFNDKQAKYHTGVSVTHHWLQGVVIVQDIEKFINFMTRFHKSAAGVVYHWEIPYSCGRVWKNHARATNGSIFAFTQLDGGMWDCWFSLPGKACEQMGVKEQARKIVQLFRDYKAGFTRIDAKARLPLAIAPMKNFIRAHDRRDFKIAQKPGGINYSLKSDGEKSYTVYFGSRESESFTRVYDPEVCHGVKGATDIEVVLKDGKAKEYAKLLTELWESGDEENWGLPDDELAKFIASVAVGHVDFIDQNTATRRSNCKRWWWWQRILDYLQTVPIRLSSERVKKSFERFLGFCERNVYKTMAAYAVAVQDVDWVLRMLKNKIIEYSNKLNPEHYALIDSYQMTEIHQILS